MCRTALAQRHRRTTRRPRTPWRTFHFLAGGKGGTKLRSQAHWCSTHGVTYPSRGVEACSRPWTSNTPPTDVRSTFDCVRNGHWLAAHAPLSARSLPISSMAHEKHDTGGFAPVASEREGGARRANLRGHWSRTSSGVSIPLISDPRCLL
ncbi:hypothetical protein BC628DRAFT_873305 [Trametes gibbosa]|nr:hypothetical protein BC628DRAFT_873305 [Trametes gibbosa]